jgi:hypothetical protein
LPARAKLFRRSPSAPNEPLGSDSAAR